MRTKQAQAPGLFDYQIRMEQLIAKGFALERLDSRIDWEMFRSDLEGIFPAPAKRSGGRPRWDVVLMFKVLVLQRYYNLSDEQAEFQIRDRLTFQRFLGLSLSDSVPDEKTIWVYREKLVQGGLFEKLFDRFGDFLKEAGLQGSEGKIVDASFVDVPRQRNTREENADIKAGAIPLEFGKDPNRLEQKDTQARWTKKGNELHFGYKNHVKANQKSKMIEDYKVTEANVHDSEVIEALTEQGDGELHADSAYAGEPVEKVLASKEIKSLVHERAYRNKPLSEEQKASNRVKSKTRARVEHIFGFMTQAMKDGLKLKYIGLKRITGAVGLLNLVYNLARYEQILRLA